MPPKRINVLDLTLCALDFETTGLSVETGDRIVEMAFVRIEPGGTVSDRWVTLVDPQRPVAGTEIHGIRDEDVVGAPRFVDVLPAVQARIEGCVLVAHNMPFEWRFLSAEMLRAGASPPEEAPRLCTLAGARRQLDLGSHRLVRCLDHFGIELVDAHSALADTIGCAELCVTLARAAEEAGRGFLLDRDWFRRVIPTSELPAGRTHLRPVRV